MTALATPKENKPTSELETLIEWRVLGSRSCAINIIAPHQQAQLIQRGISGAVLRRISKHIPKHILINTVDSDKTNFSKLYKRKHLSKAQGDEVNDLSLVWSELREFFEYDDSDVHDWIATPLPILDGMTPDSLLDTFAGRVAIRNTLNKMRYGDFG